MMEYIMFIVALCAAFAVMDVYFKRAVQGHLKGSTDSIGGQFSAENSNYTYLLTEKKRTQDRVEVGGASRTDLLDDEIKARSHHLDDFSNKTHNAESLFE